MDSIEDRILGVLGYLLELDEVHACMLAKKGMVSVVPPTEGFDPHVRGIWEVLQASMNEFFAVIDHYSKQGLGEVYFRLMDYEVMFFILPDTDSALVAIVPALANKGLLEVELEDARERIIGIILE